MTTIYYLNLYLSFTFLNNGVDIGKLFAASTERMRRIFNQIIKVTERGSCQKTVRNLQNSQEKCPVNIFKFLIGCHRQIHLNCRRNIIKTSLR